MAALRAPVIEIVLALLARDPFGKAIVGRCGPGVMRHTALIPELGALAGGQVERAVLRLEVHLAGDHRSEAAILRTVDAVTARGHRFEAAFGREDVELARRFVAAQAQREAAVVQTYTHVLVVEVDELDFGVAGQAHRAGADLDRRARAALGRDAVTFGDRAVAAGLDPFALLVVEHPDGALEIGNAADAPGRVGPDGAAGQQRQQSQRQADQRLQRRVTGKIGSLRRHGRTLHRRSRKRRLPR